MLWAIIVILVIRWLLGFFGRNISPSFPRTGGWMRIPVMSSTESGPCRPVRSEATLVESL
jgi:hypothetical protein